MRALWFAFIISFAIVEPALCGLPTYDALLKFHIGETAFGAIEPVLTGRPVLNFSNYDCALRQGRSWYIIPDDANDRWAVPLNWPIFLITWDWLSYPLSEFDRRSADGSVLREMRIREKHTTIARETSGWHVYFIQRFYAIIGAFKIRIKLNSKIYSSRGRAAYIFNLDDYRHFDFFGGEDNRLIFWNADFYLYPWPIGGNQRFAINFVRLLGGTSLHVGCFCGVSHSICGTSGLSNRISSIAFLTIRYVPGEIDRITEASRLYAEDDSLPDKCKELQDADSNERGCEPEVPPIGRRLGSSIALLLFAFCCCFIGGKYLYDDRPILSAAWFGAAVLSGVTAFALIGSLSFQNTWGWWL